MWKSKKQNKRTNIKWKQSDKYREQVSGCQRRDEWGGEKI